MPYFPTNKNKFIIIIIFFFNFEICLKHKYEVFFEGDFGLVLMLDRLKNITIIMDIVGECNRGVIPGSEIVSIGNECMKNKPSESILHKIRHIDATSFPLTFELQKCCLIFVTTILF